MISAMMSVFNLCVVAPVARAELMSAATCKDRISALVQFLISSIIEVQSAGSPGLFDNMIPSDSMKMISSAVVWAGYTVTSNHADQKRFGMLIFAPKSSSATFFPVPSRTYFSLHVTLETTSPTV